MESRNETPRRQVIKAIKFESPAYVPAWYNYFASETRQQYGERLVELLRGYPDDVLFAVLSTFPPADQMPPGWTDEWGCSWMRGAVGAVSVNSPLADSWDRLDWYLAEALPRLGERVDLLERVSAIKQTNPDQYLVATTWLAVFERLRALRGGENVLTDLYLYPNELARLRDGVADAFVAQIRGIAPQGAEAVLLADDWGTQHALLVRPDQWRRFFAPCYERLVDEIHALGMHAWFHSCGHVRPILADLIAIGFDVLHPLQPSALDVAEVAETFGGQICFAGGVDVQALLPLVHAEEVDRAIRQIIGTLARPAGGFIVAPTNSIMPDTPFENIETMCRAMWSYGRGRRPERRGDERPS
jgi:hypothetical protein